MLSKTRIPLLFIQNKGEDVSTKIALSLTRAREKTVIRLTGGCGNMSAQDANGLYQMFLDAFDSEFGGAYLFGGAFLFGGTQMRLRSDTSTILPGITEIIPLLKEQCPESVSLGIVPKTSDLIISENLGLIVSDDSPDFITIIHPNQDNCLLVQQSVDEGVDWDAEYLMCIKIIRHLVDYAGWRNLLISYNGGTVTEKEILAWARSGWPVLLIKDSGRKSGEYATNQEFLNLYPNVHVALKDSISIKEKLKELKVLSYEPFKPKIVQRKII